MEPWWNRLAEAWARVLAERWAAEQVRRIELQTPDGEDPVKARFPPAVGVETEPPSRLAESNGPPSSIPTN
jgi:hypothetical protein